MEAADLKHAELIDSILDTALHRMRCGQGLNIEEYCQQHPDLADELRVMLPALAMLEKPQQESAGPISDASIALTQIPLKLADFRIISEIGRGAMGIVYEAIQHPLERRVALKIMFQTGASNASQSRRFQREAEIAAQLHHTNIIPVFEAGEFGGKIYYAMQLIKGANLQQLIAARKRRSESDHVAPLGTQGRPSNETEWRVGSTAKIQQPTVIDRPSRSPSIAVELSPRLCAEIALQVAEGLAFAHIRGILHRDIKPSNIMLDHDCRAWIADFGLAKSSDGVDLTATGDVVGTVRYLAPERFRGQTDHRSDIYALGLTLFEMIEGTPAFQEIDQAQLIARILQGTVPEFTVQVPPDLATICLKCVQQAPVDRYSTASELAADLRKFLDGQPITARPLSMLTKFLRWCGQNKRIAALTAFIILGTGLGFVASQWQARNLRQVKAESKASSQLADRNQLDLLKTVDNFCQMVSENRRVYRDDFQDLRNLLLESANEISTQSTTQSNLSDSAKFQLASILERLGKMSTSDDTLADSESFLIRARDLILELSSETREDPKIAIELAVTLRQLASIYSRMGKSDAAQNNVLESISILNQVLTQNGLARQTRGGAQTELARTYAAQGNILFEMRQQDDSEAAINQSIQIWEETLLAEPENVNAAFELAIQWTRLGSVLISNLKKWREAETPINESLRLYKLLDERMPDRPDLNFWQAHALCKQAKWFFIANKSAKAIISQRAAIALLEELHLLFERDLAVQLELGISLRQLADFLLTQDPGDPEILTLLESSEQILTLAVAGDPDNLPAVFSLEKAYLSHGEILQKLNFNAEALEKVDLAIQTLDCILVTKSSEARAIEERYFAALIRASLLTDLSRPEDALSEWDMALKYAPPSFVEIVKMDRTRTIAKTGRHRQATEQAEAILARLLPASMQNQHLLRGSAITFAVAAQVVLQEDGNPDSQAQSERYALRAIELLEFRQVASGNVSKFLETEPDLQFLVDRPDYQRLMEAADSPKN